MLYFDKEIILNCDALPSPNSLTVSLETDDFIIVVKGSSLPSAPLKGGQRSVMDILFDEKPYLKSVQGRNDNESGLLHRIDNDTRGLLLIAKTQAFYDYIQETNGSGSFVKTYTAYSKNFPGADSYKRQTFPFEVKSRFRSFGKNGAAVKPVFEDSGRASQKKAGNREYTTEILSVSPFLETPACYKIEAAISAGFRHQVRAHLASLNSPVFGDRIYGADAAVAENSGLDADGKLNGNSNGISNGGTDKEEMLFFASGLCFSGLNGERCFYRLSPALLDSDAERTFLTSLTR